MTLTSRSGESRRPAQADGGTSVAANLRTGTLAAAAHLPRVGAQGGAAGGGLAAGGFAADGSTANASAADGFAADREAVRTVLHRHAKGVAVITVVGADRPVGFCATSLATVSIEPPVLSFAIRKRSSSWPAVAAADQVMIHLLAEDQAELAHRFGTSGGAKFGAGTGWAHGADGLPVLDGALAWILLAVIRRVHCDEHAIVLGRVTAVRASAGRRPLIHHDGAYGALA